MEDNIKDKLERLDGVASVELRGGGEREVLIRTEKPYLDLYGVTQDKIVQAVRAENINISGGFIEEGFQELSLRTMGEYGSLEEIENTIVTFKGETPIYIKDIANVFYEQKETRGCSRTNGRPSILMMINKQSGANTVEVVDAVKEEVPELNKFLPEGTEFALVMDQSRQVKSSIGSASRSGIVGGLLAIFVIFIFLRNWRPTVAIAFAIPLSIIATFIPLYATGYTLNLMTLGGLALGVGMLVDNAVVVIENIFRHLGKTGKRQKSAILGAREVGNAIIAATLTTVAVFVPMALGTGIAGQLSRGLSLTIIFALTSSLFVSLTIVPMIASKIFTKPRNKNELEDISAESKLMRIQGIYKKMLAWSLKNRFKTLGATIVLLIGVIVLTPFIGTEFMPTVERSLMLLQIKMPIGTSLNETDNTVKKIETVMLNKVGNNIISATSFVGQSDETAQGGSFGLGGGGVNEAIMLIRLKDKGDRELSTSQIEEIIRKNTPPIRGLEVVALDMAGVMTGGSNSPIEIKIFGSDLEKLQDISDDISEKISDVEGLRNIDTSLSEGKPELVMDINKEKASHLGLTVGQIGSAVKNYMRGTVATQFRQEGEETDIRVRLGEEYRDSLDHIQNLNITSSLGQQIALDQVVTISRTEGPTKIERENQIRTASVTANVLDRDVGSVAEEIQERLENKQLPAGYSIEYGGSYKQMKETFSTLGLALLLAILLVYMVMASQFESLVHPFIVMFELPLAFIGVGLALFLTGQSLSLPSFIGVIMLSGIVVNNAIVLIDYVNQLRAKGLSEFDALLEGGVVRLRPILITTITTILGMLPLALARSEGSEMMRPMAIAVIGGLLVSSILTLVVIPVIYSLVEKFSRRAYNRVGRIINGGEQ